MDARKPKPPFPVQHQEKPGLEKEMSPRPKYEAPKYKPAGKLEGKVALITGGDSGIGRAVAVLYAKEGADVAISYLREEHEDAEETRARVEEAGRRCILIPGDLADPEYCKLCVERTVKELGKIDILVHNAAHQNRKESILDVEEEEWDRTFKVNIYAYYRLIKAAVPHLPRGSAILATGSVVGVLGRKSLPDYSATKGAIHTLTKTLAPELLEKGIRINVVAPGPVWTPLNIADQGADDEKVKTFGEDTPAGRPAQPEEIAPAFVFLACEADSSYITGFILQELGGETTGG
jgi:NAD(P)-dependent dehydrogenase (short-subunit alcohol dehydrogenase family)